MASIMNRRKLGKNCFFLKFSIVTKDLSPMKLGSSFLILLHQLESFSNVTTAFWLHRENKMHKLGTEVHLYYYYLFFFSAGKEGIREE